MDKGVGGADGCGRQDGQPYVRGAAGRCLVRALCWIVDGVEIRVTLDSVDPPAGRVRVVSGAGHAEGGQRWPWWPSAVLAGCWDWCARRGLAAEYRVLGPDL